MDLDKTNLEKNQERMRKFAARRYLLERATVLAIFFLIFAISLNFQAGTFTMPSLEGLRGDITRIGTGSSTTANVTPPVVDKKSGDYPKGDDLYVAVSLLGPGEARYSVNEKPTINSPLYGGYSVNVRTGEPTSTLYVFTVDSFGNASEVVEYTYNFVPNPVSNFRAIPRDQGRVDLTWDASTDPDLDHYNVYVGDNEPVSARKNTAYTVSGLPLNEQTFSVTVVDKYKMESEKVTKKLLLSQVTTDESGMVHGAGVEISPDLNADGVVNAKDARILFEQLQGGVSAEVFNEMMRCWEKEGCVL